MLETQGKRCLSSASTQLPTAAQQTLFEVLERRQMLAAHIFGIPTSYGSIQAAVNAALPGAIINVDPGTYSEQITINKQLTLRGAQAGVDARGNARLYGATSAETILNGYDTGAGRTPAIIIKANDVVIDGFTIQGNTTGGDYQSGLIIGPRQHGTYVLDNIVQNNVTGLFLSNDSATDAALIQYNVFRNNNNAGTNGGKAIYTDGGVSGGNLTNVTIDSNFFYNNRGGAGNPTQYEAAINFLSLTPNSQSNFTITNNTFDTNGKGVLAWNLTGITIKYNTITNTLDHWSGTWRFEGDVKNADIEYNNSYNNTGTAIRVDNKGFSDGQNSSGFVIEHNNFYGNSNFYSNRESIVVGADQYDGTFDARNNWWGSIDGPSGVQSSSGDAITPYDNTVLFSPWATTPVVSTDTSFFGLPFSTGSTIQAEDFDQGGEGNAYHDSDTVNSGAKYRTTGVDVESTSDTGGGYDVGFFTAGEWMKYNVNVTQPGTYNIDFRVANQTAGGKFHLEVDGVNVTGSISVPNTTNFQIWQTITRTGVVLSAGSHVLRIVGDANSTGGRVGNLNWFKLTNTAALPAAPSNLLAVGASTSEIDLSWKDNATNEASQKIERSTDGINFSPRATVGAGVTGYADTGLTNGQTYWYRVRASNAAGDSANSNIAFASPVPANAPPVYISDLPWLSATTGWGAAQLDQTIKGQSISLRGVTYAKGIGTHADSTIVYNLAGAYTNFVSDVGVDDEVSGNGNLIFRVIGDGQVLFDSGLLTGASPVVHVNVDVTGVQQLTLIAANGVDGVDYDHADWAGAELFKSPPVLTVPSAPANLNASALANSVITLSWLNTTNAQTSVTIERSPDGITFTPLATVSGATNSYNDSGLSASTKYDYRIHATNTAGDSVGSNVANATTQSPSQPATYLSDLRWVSATSGYQTVQNDATILGKTISLKGVTYGKGLGTHAVSNIVYNINGQYTAFVSDVGIDDEENGIGEGSVIFQVFGDGKLLFDSGVLTNDSATVHINVSVAGVQQLTLVATNGVAGNVYFDHADWAGAKLLA